jgi:hypothetical protein
MWLHPASECRNRADGATRAAAGRRRPLQSSRGVAGVFNRSS